MPAPAPLSGMPRQRFPRSGSVNFVTVGRPLREIDGAGLRGGGQAAGACHRLGNAIPGTQMVQAGLLDRACDVYDDVIAAYMETIAAMTRARAGLVAEPRRRGGQGGHGRNWGRPQRVPEREGDEREGGGGKSDSRYHDALSRG